MRCALFLIIVPWLLAGREGSAAETGCVEIARATGAACEQLYVDHVIRGFAKYKLQQLHASSEAEGFAINPAFERLFDGMKSGNTGAVAAAYDWIRPRVGQYGRKPGDPEVDSTLNNGAWQYVLEAHGAWGEFRRWPPDLLCGYARDIQNSMPTGAIFFGGTDPGRFVITAFHDMTLTNELLIITQNALADYRYVAYVRRLIGDRVNLPSDDDLTKSFQEFVEDWKAGRAPPGADLKIENGRVQVTGVDAVMAINAIIARKIFDRNPSRRFFVEESYVIPWMYPHLVPHDLIMELCIDPVPLTTELVAADFKFWDNREKVLRAQPAFQGSVTTQKTYAKLRVARASLYAARNRAKDAEKAFEQARRLFPASPEAHFRLTEDVLLKQKRYAEAQKVMLSYKEHMPMWFQSQREAGDPVDQVMEQERVDTLLKKIMALKNDEAKIQRAP